MERKCLQNNELCAWLAHGISKTKLSHRPGNTHDCTNYRMANNRCERSQSTASEHLTCWYACNGEIALQSCVVKDFHSIFPEIEDLHWTPCAQRITFQLPAIEDWDSNGGLTIVTPAAVYSDKSHPYIIDHNTMTLSQCVILHIVQC